MPACVLLGTAGGKVAVVRKDIAAGMEWVADADLTMKGESMRLSLRNAVVDRAVAMPAEEHPPRTSKQLTPNGLNPALTPWNDPVAR